MNPSGLPSRLEAEELLAWADSQNPGQWSDHSRVVARVAETIAKHCGLDAEKAYIFGLLHDIGRYDGVRDLHHVYAGFKLMTEKSYDAVARICLSHSFPFLDIEAYSGRNDCAPDELPVITSFLSGIVYDDYDRLIQLCDSMGTAQGICMIENRLVDVARRYGFKPLTPKKWDSVFALKAHFDELSSKNIYSFFRDEIVELCIR